jgi:glycosyltransferase involved in cell wall biosynthesis
MENVIKHDNIFYIRDFSEIGGVETFTWELVKKFKDYDIAVVYKQAHPNQLNRVRKYCKAYKHSNQKIECKVAIINYDVSIIDFINDGAVIYQTIHGDYENPAYQWKPPTHERIKEYIAVTKYIQESFKRITGLKNVTYSYNPLSIEKEEKKLVLLSATRLSRIKGKNRMIKLANELDIKGINYIWYIFTNDKEEIKSPNVVYMKPRLDIGYWMEQADYVVQLSDTEACSYTINEALYRNIPVIVTPLPYLEEIGVKDGKNAYIMEFDCSNVKDIVEKIKTVPKFIFDQLKDRYGELVYKGKSHYEEDRVMRAKVKAKMQFNDVEENVKRKEGEEWVCSLERAEFLKEHGGVEVLEVFKDAPEVKKEEPKLDKKTAKKKNK